MLSEIFCHEAMSSPVGVKNLAALEWYRVCLLGEVSGHLIDKFSNIPNAATCATLGF